MTVIRLALGSFLITACFASGSMAQGVQRTFVSGGGSDSNPCSRTAPCRTFAQAMSQTASGGEVVVLDSAGYGPFTITQPITVTAPLGVYAGISVFSGDGIDINAGGSDTIILRGLTLNNQGGTGSGIVFTTGRALHIEGCVINGFSNTNSSGVVLAAGSGILEVKDSIIRGNYNGINLTPVVGTHLAMIDQVRLELNFRGLLVQHGSKVSVRNSVASGNATGLDAF